MYYLLANYTNNRTVTKNNVPSEGLVNLILEQFERKDEKVKNVVVINLSKPYRKKPTSVELQAAP